MMKMYKAKFATSHLTADILRSEYKWVADDKVIELIADALRNVNGIEVGAAEWNYSPGNFSILGHNLEDDTPLKELVWAVEQDGGIYCDDRERFDSDWSKGEYEPEGSMHFEQEWFEVTKFLKEIN